MAENATWRCSNLAINSKLRECDVVHLKVEDIAPQGLTSDQACVRQQKTGHPVKFELTEQTLEAMDANLQLKQRHLGEYLFESRGKPDHCTSTRQYSRLVASWISSIGLDPRLFGTHSLRRTKATLIYRRKGNSRAVQLLLGHTKIESTVRYIGIEVDDALAIAEQVEVRTTGAERTCSAPSLWKVRAKGAVGHVGNRSGSPPAWTSPPGAVGSKAQRRCRGKATRNVIDAGAWPQPYPAGETQHDQQLSEVGSMTGFQPMTHLPNERQTSR